MLELKLRNYVINGGNWTSQLTDVDKLPLGVKLLFLRWLLRVVFNVVVLLVVDIFRRLLVELLLQILGLFLTVSLYLLAVLYFGSLLDLLHRRCSN